MKNVLLIITGFSQENLRNKREISEKEFHFLSENNITSDFNVEFFHLKLQGSQVLDSFLKRHVSYTLCIFFTDGISEMIQGIYKTYISEKRDVSFLEKLPENVKVLETC